MKKFSLLILLVLTSITVFGQKDKRWNFTNDSGIRWNVTTGHSHIDHIEMSGLQISVIVYYGISDKGELQVKRKLIFPMLRTIPNNTYASLIVDFNESNQLQIIVNGTESHEFPKTFSLKGKLIINSTTNTPLEVMRTISPSVDKPALIEIITLKNKSNTSCVVEIKNNSHSIETDPSKGVYGQYIVDMDVKNTGIHTIVPNEEYSFGIVYSGRKLCEEKYSYSPIFELNKRIKFVDDLFDNLILETPNDTINREFAFSKIRATESIYDTKGGLMHGPGGGAYYAAIWANDQAEYANPFFPFVGNMNGNESAINSYRHFARYMNSEYKPIPSSIIAEGASYWNGAGDRGDQAMIAYGASRFALAYGKIETAKELWPLITWCLEYLERKKTVEGIIVSDTDELEGRFPAGKVNLSTNALTYGAYISAAYLAAEFGLKDLALSYQTKALALRNAIEKYFGANVQGFNTYRYYDGNTKLRSWICLPLVMGITNRKEETIKALFSNYLWSPNGILTESGSRIFWDRSTLYAFRGLFASGATNECMKYFSYYSSTRLLGEHVPYPVEAWPEGDQRHLAAESALYCRVVTEGLFGITPTGLNKFTIAPWLPKGWNYMKIKNIKAFNRTFDIEISRKGSGETITVKMANGIVITKEWKMKDPITVVLP